MSSSESPKMKPGDVAAFRLPSLQTETTFFAPDAKNYVFQALIGDVPSQATFLESNLSKRVEQVLAEAEAKRQYIEEKAYEEGFRQGQKDGQEVGRRGLEEIVQRFETMLVTLAEEKERLFHQRERELVELALAISRKIIGRELNIQPEAVREVLATAFHHLRECEPVRLLVHPQDYELVMDYAQASWPQGLEVIADSSLSPGGFVLETDQGEIDGTPETRWAKINQVIDHVLGNRDEN